MSTVQVFKSSEGSRFKNWYVRLVSVNGETLALSEGYVSKWNAIRAAKKNFPGTTLRVINT